MGRAMLLLVSGLVIVSGMIQMSNNTRIEVLPERTSEYYYEAQAKNISASLIDNAIQNLLIDMEWTGTISSDNYYVGSGKLLMYNMDSSGLDTLEHSVQQWDEYRTLLISRGNYGGYTAEIEVLMQRDSFSKFSYFTNAEQSSTGSNIWWFGDDEVTGPVHSNGTFRMAGSPTFNGFISSPNDWIEHDDGADPNFNGGSNFSLSKDRDLPGSEQINALEAAAGLSFNGDKDVEFYIDADDEGYVEVADAGCSHGGCRDTYKLSDYDGGDGVILSIDGDANVKGTVKGNITLHAVDDIEIMGDIYYNTNPLTDSTATDLLGLVSENNVIVDENAHEDNGSGDLTIHASIMALNTSFIVEDYSDYGHRGDLNILGGIIQKNRGPVGTFGGHHGTTGYTKNYVYDTRLLNTTPPLYPRESIFTIVYWKEKLVNKPNS